MNTVAGNGYAGYGGDGGPATQATLGTNTSIAFDAAGNLYIAESVNRRVRRVDAVTGIITTAAGNGILPNCRDGALARDACMGVPRSLTLDTAGNLFYADAGTQAFRKVRADNGTIEGVQTLLGQEPRAIAVDAAGNVFYSGGVGYYVYRRDAITGTAAVYAGNGNGQYGGDGGQATGAMIQGVEDLAFDSAGNLFIADSENHRIRRIDAATGIITTYAGNGQPSGALGDGGLATAASLNRPSIIRFDAAGNLIIVDRLHHRVRKVDPTTRVITTIAGNGDGSGSITGNGGPAIAAGLGTSPAIAIDPTGNVFIAAADTLRKVDVDTGIIDAVPAPPGGLVTPEGMTVQQPLDMEFDSYGRLYVGDGISQVIFRVTDVPVELPDTSPPVIEPSILGVLGGGDWFTSNVQVSWSVTDAQSSIASQAGCATTSVAEDSASCD